MDAVELGRQEAAKINAELVAAGCDPWSPMALVEAAAKRAGIAEITALKPGSALLTRSRAQYDPQSHSILHENTGDAFMNAFLIGHELGHATLGDARLPDQACTPDPSRSSEAAPDGEERVADYSRKSRREVQMDLFSRELILPRAFVRAQHLAGMTAEAIAARLGAPHGAVAQQLLDALLLPAVMLETEDADEFPLNERQECAARHRGDAFLLEAGPGTGKTKTLVGRVCDLLARDDADPRRIVVLTYSNKAAGELSERIARRAPEAAAAMWIGTFHAYGLNLIRRYHQTLGFAREPRLIDRAEAVALMLDRVAGLELQHYRDLSDPTDKLRDLLSAISRAQDEVVLAPRYAELVEAMLVSDDSPAMRERVAKAREVARVYANYAAAKQALGRIDFGDLVALPTHLLETNTEVANAVAQEIDHVLVDEYQDVNRASVRLLKRLCPGGRNLWCVGDVRQSIYRFRGASSFNLARFDTDDFAGAKRSQLQVNYRSHEEVIDAYSAFASKMEIEGATPVALEAHRGRSGHAPEFRYVQGDTERQIDAVADAILEMRDAGFAYRDQALLCSGNDKLAELGAGLEARGIPILYLGSLFERPEVKDLLAWLSLLLDRRAIERARAHQTWQPRRQHLDAAGHMRDLAAARGDAHAHVDRGHQMLVGGLADHRPARMRIGAQEDEVEPTDPARDRFIDNVADDRADLGGRIDREREAPRDLDLGEADIAGCGADKAVQVGGFDAIGIDDREIPRAQMRELLDRRHAGAPGADDEQLEPFDPALPARAECPDLAVMPRFERVRTLRTAEEREPLTDLPDIDRLAGAELARRKAVGPDHHCQRMRVGRAPIEIGLDLGFTRIVDRRETRSAHSMRMGVHEHRAEALGAGTVGDRDERGRFERS